MKSSGWKKLGIILAVLVVFVIAAALVIPRLIDANRYRGLIAAQIQEVTGGKVSLGRITWGIAGDVWVEVDGFSVMGATVFPGEVKVGRVHTEVSVIPLLSKKIVVDELQIEDLLLTLRLEPTAAGDRNSVGKTSSAVQGARGGAEADDASPTSASLPVQIMIQDLGIKKGRVILEDSLTLPGEKVVRVFSDVELEARNLSPGEEMAFQLALRDESKPSWGTLRTEGTFSGLTEAFTLQNPKLRVKATISSVEINVIKPYLKESPLARRLGGTVSLEVDYDGGLGPSARAEGLIDLSKLSYTDPSMWDNPLPGSETKIIYHVTLGPEDLDVEKIHVKVGGLTLNAHALVKGWRKEPVVKDAVVSSELPLTDLIPFIPWKKLGKNADVILDVLKEGGRVTIQKAALPEINPRRPPATADALLSELEVKAQVSGISFRPTTKLPKVENIRSAIQLQKGVATVEGLTGRLGQTNLPHINARITNLLEKPRMIAHFEGPLELDNITDEKALRLLRELGIKKLGGRAGLDLTLHLETDRPKEFRLQGKVGLKDVQVNSSLVPALLEGLDADLAFSPNTLEIRECSTMVVVPPIDTSPGGRFSLKLNGHVKNWHHQPLVTLRELRTSQISLPSLAPTVPWEKLGESSQMIRQTLLAGGEVTIENLAFFELDPERLAKGDKNLISRIKGALSFSGISAQPSLLAPRLEGIEGRVTLEKGVLRASQVRARMGPLTLPTLDFHATNLTRKPKVLAKAKGPLRLERTADANVEKLLMRYGLKSLSGNAELDMSVRYDQTKPVRFEANGSLVFGGFRAETHPKGVLLEDLRGQVSFSRRKTIDVTVNGLEARINKAPIRLDGKLSGFGTPHMLVQAKTRADRLDLGHLADLVPPLAELGLGGNLDMNLDVYFPYRYPMKTRLKGKMRTRGFRIRLAEQGIAVREGDAHFQLEGNRVQIKNTRLYLNEQELMLAGRVTNPLEPDVQLHLKSPYLNLDRLVPTKKEKGPKKAERKVQEETLPEDKPQKKNLPPLAQKLTAHLEVEAAKGQYRGEEFQDLKLRAIYERGVLKTYELDMGIAGGQIQTAGSADLRDLERIPFTVQPTLKSVRVERIVALFGIDKFHLQGPLMLTGSLEGRAGNGRELLSSLKGHLEGEISQGRVLQLGTTGETVGRILAVLSPTSLLFVRMKNDFAEQGIPFSRVKTNASFEGGHIIINESRIESQALNGDAHGTVDLMDQQLDMEVDIEPLATVDKALRFVPVFGKAAEDLAAVYLEVKGPLKNPDIRLRPTRGAKQPVKDLEKEAGSVVEKFKGLFGK